VNKYSKNAELQAEQESIKLIEKFTSFRKNEYRRIQAQEEKGSDDLDYDQYEEEILEQIDKLEDNLMDVEMKL